MKTQKLFVIAASVCLLAVFLPGSAHAQEPLSEIIQEFCDKTAAHALEAADELAEATADLADCFNEFDDCLGGLFGGDSVVDCLNKANRCISRANNERHRACKEFGREFEDDYDDALRRARFKGVENLFLIWLNSQSSQECLAPAIQMSAVCAGLIE